MTPAPMADVLFAIAPVFLLILLKLAVMPALAALACRTFEARG